MMHCRHCQTTLSHQFLDLGFAPPSNAYLLKEDLQKPELIFPLKLFVCDQCWLVQTLDYNDAQSLFTKDYAYFSSTSTGWLLHAKDYCEKIQKRLLLTANSFVIEIASNDGYLLKNFVSKGIPCLGIEPTASTALAARSIGIDTLEQFFDVTLAENLTIKNIKADLIIGNNVYAHVPDINDFTKGIEILLNKEGVVTLEFPHILELIKHVQFDTVYHEHYSYLSLYTVKEIFSKAGLRVWDVEKLHTHGGSLRVYGCKNNASYVQSNEVNKIINEEITFQLKNINFYKNFQLKINKIKNDLLYFLINRKNDGKSIAAYGAAAKGNTFINYAGIKSDFVDFVCDAATAKQGKYMPGSHIPILSPTQILINKPDYIWILPWNIKNEIITQLSEARAYGAKFIIATPTLEIL
jgi:C-methyltransferase C-terminal domain/Putative zinc binding domain/Methyltransferase domain